MDSGPPERLFKVVQPFAAELDLQLAQAVAQGEPSAPELFDPDGALSPLPAPLEDAAGANVRLPFDQAGLESAAEPALVELLLLGEGDGPYLILSSDTPLASAASSPLEAPPPPAPNTASERPLPESEALFAPEDISVEPTQQAPSSPLALNDGDLFGGAGPMQVLTLGQEDLVQQADDFRFELFGEPPEFVPGAILISASVLTPVPEKTLPPPPVPKVGPGFLGLDTGFFKFTLTPELAATYADANGDLLIQGDGNDTVLLTSDWVYAGFYGSVSDIYQTVDGAYTVEIRDAAVEYQVFV